MKPNAAPVASLPEPILVVGAYGYRNLGDEAILAGLLRELGTEARLTVVSRSPAETEALHRVRAVGLASVIGELRRHRSVLIGGGGLFGRDMGRLGRLIAPFGVLAAATGRTVAVHGVGIDRSLPITSVQALRLLARQATAFSVRDSASLATAAGWGIEAALVDDPSGAMPSASRQEGRALLRGAGLDLSRPIVGLSLTDVEPAIGRQLAPAVRQLVDALPEVQFCVIPMSQHPFVPPHNDLLLGLRLQAEVPRLAVLKGFHHPSRVLAAFGVLSGAICMRYHSLLFAERARTPIVAVPYAEKCETWLAERGMAATPLTGPALVDSLRSVMAPRLVKSA
jgi:polysaccharide pyruvyl transferase WcaK-like protein